jgi:hypothetical protein
MLKLRGAYDGDGGQPNDGVQVLIYDVPSLPSSPHALCALALLSLAIELKNSA